MADEHVFRFESQDENDTEKFAEQIGQKLKGGEVIEIIGDVGAGKTTFVRGLARGIGSDDRVSSPTFTVSKVYSGEKVTLHHYDFYRLDDFTIIQQDLAEILEAKDKSVVLEWADNVQGVLPADRNIIKIDVTGENSRSLTCSMPEKFIV